MKKIYFLLLLLLASTSSATVKFYGTGNTGQGFNDFSGNGNDASAVGIVGQPTTAPVPEGDKWFGFVDPNDGCGNYVEMNINTLPNGSEGSSYFWMRVTDPSAVSFDSLIYTASTVAGVGTSYFIIRFGSGTMLFQENGGPTAAFSYAPFNDNAYHLIHVRWGSFGAEIYVDGVLQASNGTPAVTHLFTLARLFDFPSFGFGGCATGVLIDAFQIGDSADDAYLGPGLPTPTPTFSGTPTLTISPTFTVSPTPTPTPTITVTPIVIPPQNLQLGVLQPNGSVGLSWDDRPEYYSWNLYFNGILKNMISRSQVSTVSGRDTYQVGNLPANSNFVMTLRALVNGKRLSDESGAVTITTSSAPFTYYARMAQCSLDRFTTTGPGATYFSFALFKTYSVQMCSSPSINEGGPVPTITVNFETSLDGIHFYNVLTASDPSCTIVFPSAGGSVWPAPYFRANCTSLNLNGADYVAFRIMAIP